MRSSKLRRKRGSFKRRQLGAKSLAPFAPEAATPASELLLPKEAAPLLRTTTLGLSLDRHKAKRKEVPPRVPYIRLGGRIYYRRMDIQSAIERGLVA